MKIRLITNGPLKGVAITLNNAEKDRLVKALRKPEFRAYLTHSDDLAIENKKILGIYLEAKLSNHIRTGGM